MKAQRLLRCNMVTCEWLEEEIRGVIPEYGVMGAAWASVIGCSIMLSFSKLLCGDEERLSDGLALFSVAICYLLSIGSSLALIGLLTLIPAKNSIDFLRSQTGYSQEE